MPVFMKGEYYRDGSSLPCILSPFDEDWHDKSSFLVSCYSSSEKWRYIYFILYTFYNCIAPVGFFPMENSGCFPQEKPAVTE